MTWVGTRYRTLASWIKDLNTDARLERTGEAAE